MWFKRRIAIEDALAIMEKAKELMAEGAEIRAPIRFSLEDEEEEPPPSLSPEDASFIADGGTTPDYGEDEEDDED